MELENFFENFSHDHPLILKEEHDENSIPPCCLVCGKIIVSDPFYSCQEKCNKNIFFHKTCSELPLSIQHTLHPDHRLTLRSVSGSFYFCDACKIDCKNYVYECFTCDFGLDLKCASIITRESIEHPGHKHPLQISRRTYLCFCDACGTKHEGVFYSCSICDEFWIHEDCASLPTTFEDTDYHVHPLTLAYSLPDQYTFSVHCQICEKYVYRSLWLYHCDRCRFAFHVNCVTPQREHFLSVLLPKKQFYSSQRKSETNSLDYSDLDVVHLPLRDDVSSLADHFFSSIQLRATPKTTRSSINCHRRPLIRSFDDVQGTDTRLDILHDHEKYQKKLCNACIRPVATTPFYKCVNECNFILHESCAQLPREIQHPFHSKHVLALTMTRDFNYFQCECCHRNCNGFRYSCEECKYHLDVICASLPTTIIYEPHTNHKMTLKEKISRHCNACYYGQRISLFAYNCDECDFELHAICALYPSKIRYRFDETHPYSLTYRHVEGHDSDYFCDICENQMNPELWFYHCVECDKSMHTNCHPTYDRRSRMKFGGIIEIESHEHPLIMVPVIPMNTQCNGYVRVITQETICSCNCKEAFGVGPYYPMGFKCLECKYNIQYECLAKLLEGGIGCNIVRGF